ncbi:hypothetical protein D3C78_998380 [compost metagenome]
MDAVAIVSTLPGREYQYWPGCPEQQGPPAALAYVVQSTYGQAVLRHRPVGQPQHEQDIGEGFRYLVGGGLDEQSGQPKRPHAE